MTETLIGLGSNLGDRLGNLGHALEAIDALDETWVLAVSNAVESEPWGVTDQPPFANAVARVETEIPADRFLGALQDIERALGREPGVRFGPRSIDLDILLFGDDEWDAPDLRIPHPRMAERDFVVTPLLEVAPGARYPDGEPVTRDRVAVGRVTGSLGPLPGYGDLTVWVSAPADGEPARGEWVEVAGQTLSMHGVTHAAGLLFDEALLASEGIPFAWDPARPGEDISPYPFPVRHRLLVPPPSAGRARRLLAEAHSAAITDVAAASSAADGETDV